MNPADQSPEDKAALKDFFRSVNLATREGKEAAAAALDAIPRLVRACYSHDNGQAVTIARALASIYNGDNARPVQLDEIRRLDWNLQKDLVTVIIGVGQEGCPDTKIREAFAALDGEKAVEWLHWHTTGGPHKVALRRLITFIQENRQASSGRALLEMFRSITDGQAADLSRLNYMGDDLSKDFCLVLGALYGRDQGLLYIEDISSSLQKAGLV